ncbi:MAG TPA: hypothetical protein VJ654_01430 [Noviherbaspirillum sp.]|nr:hypothetical protein [Noviherbaspirillum sp.]
MRLTRRSRLATALLALFSVLFMQLAVAAYACPSLQSAEITQAAAMSMSAAEHGDMTGCEGMVDMEQPALCHAHAQAGDQSLDKPASPGVAPSVAIVLVPAIQPVGANDPPMYKSAAAAWLMQDSFPPLSIRNCCFRI